MISTRAKVVEDYRSIDVRRWHREGLLQPGRAFGWRWAWDDGLLAVAVQVRRDYVTLSCRISGSGAGPEVFSIIRLDATPCYFGRYRDWFICPGKGCERRVAVLYLKGHEFACRHCCRLKYQSQRERETMRALRRAQKIRARLCGSTDMQAPFPDKPKGMHWRTYERIRLQAKRAEARWLAGVEVWLRSR